MVAFKCRRVITANACAYINTGDESTSEVLWYGARRSEQCPVCVSLDVGRGQLVQGLHLLEFRERRNLVRRSLDFLAEQSWDPVQYVLLEAYLASMLNDPIRLICLGARPQGVRRCSRWQLPLHSGVVPL